MSRRNITRRLGDYSSAIFQPITDLAALRLQAVNDIQDKTVVYVAEEGLYAYESLSVEADNGILVLEPTVGDGRWVCVARTGAGIADSDWMNSVLNATNTPPGAPVDGSRYLITAVATAAWTGHEEEVGEWSVDALAWTFTPPGEGAVVYDENLGRFFGYAGGWAALEGAFNHALLDNLTAGDPHTQYQKESERNALNGYAGLDGAARIVAAQEYAPVLVAVGLYGDGSDGPVDFNGTSTFLGFATTVGVAPNLVYTLIRDIYCTTLDIRATKVVRTAGFQVNHTGLFTNRGKLHNDGVNAIGSVAGVHIAAEGTLGAARAGGGNGGVTIGLQTINGTVGAGSGGRNVTGNNGGNGGGAGAASGGVAGLGAVPLAIQGDVRGSWFATTARLIDGTSANGGGGGGGGGGISTVNSSAGGGGGQSGGAVKVVGQIYDGAGGIISANGGDGVNGTFIGDGIAGGGGGGNGGWVHLWFGLLASWGTETANAGGAGLGANGGLNGIVGGVGRVVKLVS